MKNIKGVVFDLDDTLYPQETYKKSGFRAVAQWLNLKCHCDVEVVYKELCRIMEEAGPSYPRMFDDLADNLRLDPYLVPQMVQNFRAHDPVIHCCPGVFHMLERLNRTCLTGILTDGLHAVQNKKIHALGLAKKVDAVLCSEGLGLAKPAWQLFAWFEDQFELSGQDLIYVGDNPIKDFIGAQARGWTTIRVFTGEFANMEASAEFEADLRLNHISEITEFLA